MRLPDDCVLHCDHGPGASAAAVGHDGSLTAGGSGAAMPLRHGARYAAPLLRTLPDGVARGAARWHSFRGPFFVICICIVVSSLEITNC